VDLDCTWRAPLYGDGSIHELALFSRIHVPEIRTYLVSPAYRLCNIAACCASCSGDVVEAFHTLAEMTKPVAMMGRAPGTHKNTDIFNMQKRRRTRYESFLGLSL
jgi:hypothetical protein